MKAVKLTLLLFVASTGFSQQTIDSLRVDKTKHVFVHHKIKCKPGLIKVVFRENKDGCGLFRGKMIMSGSEIEVTADLEGILMIRNIPPGKYDLSFTSDIYCMQNVLRVEVIKNRPAYLNIEVIKKGSAQDTCSHTVIYTKMDVPAKSICTVPKSK